MAEPARRSPQMSISCERCRRRKQKCDRKLPSCSSCFKSGALCVPAISRSSIAARVLEARALEAQARAETEERHNEHDIRQLETQLRSLENAVRQLHSAQAQGHRDLALAAGSGISPGFEGVGGNETGAGDAQGAARGALPPPGQQASTTSPLESLASIPLSVLNESQRENSAGSFSSVKLLSLLARGDSTLPTFRAQQQDRTQDTIQHLVSTIHTEVSTTQLDNYFRTFHLSYPLIDQTEVHRNWNLLNSPRPVETTQQNEELYSTLTHLILYVIVSISLMLEGRVEQKNVANRIYTLTIRLLSAKSSALTNGPMLRQPGDEARIVQFVFLLAIYRLLDPSGGSAWQLARYAMDTNVMFGFHRFSRHVQDETNSSEVHSQRKLEATKEVTVWSCFCLERDLSALLDRSCCVQPSDIDPLSPPNPASPSNVHSFLRHMVEYYQIQARLPRRRSEESFSHTAVLRAWRASAPSSLDLEKTTGETQRSLARLTDAQLAQHWDSWYYRGILESVDATTQHDHPTVKLALQACSFLLQPATEQGMKDSGFRWDTAVFFFSVGTIFANLSAKQFAAGTQLDLSEIVTGLSRCSDILSTYLAEFPVLGPYSRLWYQFSSEITMLLNVRLHNLHISLSNSYDTTAIASRRVEDMFLQALDILADGKLP